MKFKQVSIIILFFGILFFCELNLGLCQEKLQVSNDFVIQLPKEDFKIINETPEQNFILTYQPSPGDLYSQQILPWGIERIGANKFWNMTRGENVKIAIIDTGIDCTHPDLKDNVKGGISFVDSDYIDENGHGTAIAGIIAAIDNDFGVVGVAPEVDLYAVKVFKNDVGYLSDILSGIQWSIDNQMDIIVMSFGTETYSKELEEMVDKAHSSGIILIAAAGNSGDLDDDDDISYPARFDNVIAVGGIDANNFRLTYSSDGPELELVAPGEHIITTYINNLYVSYSGTSVAAPHVAGVAALTLSYNNSFTNEEVREILNKTARDLGEEGRDKHYGYGLVNAGLVAFNLLYCYPVWCPTEDGYYLDVPWQITKSEDYVPILTIANDPYEIIELWPDINNIYVCDHFADSSRCGASNAIIFTNWTSKKVLDSSNSPFFHLFLIEKDMFVNNGSHIAIKILFDLSTWILGDREEGPVYINILTYDPPKFENWYCGDTHYHSNYTGDNPIEFGATYESTKYAGKAIGLDWVISTDHSSTYSEKWSNIFNDAYHNSDTKFKIMVGEEIDCRDGIVGWNHYLGYNISEFISSNCISGPICPSCQNVIQLVNNQGGFGYAAHPEDGNWDYNIYGISGLEIWNEKNKVGNLEVGLDKMIKLWLNADKKFIEAGSDAHGQFYGEENAFGMVQTCCYSPVSVSSNYFNKSILNSLKNGHCYMTDNGALKFQISNSTRTAMLGDTIKIFNDSQITISTDYNVTYPCKLTLWKGVIGDSDETILENYGWVSGSSSEITYDSPTSNTYYRADCVNTSDNWRSYTNPIWVNVIPSVPVSEIVITNYTVITETFPGSGTCLMFKYPIISDRSAPPPGTTYHTEYPINTSHVKIIDADLKIIELISNDSCADCLILPTCSYNSSFVNILYDHVTLNIGDCLNTSANTQVCWEDSKNVSITRFSISPPSPPSGLYMTTNTSVITLYPGNSTNYFVNITNNGSVTSNPSLNSINFTESCSEYSVSGSTSYKSGTGCDITGTNPYNLTVPGNSSCLVWWSVTAGSSGSSSACNGYVYGNGFFDAPTNLTVSITVINTTTETCTAPTDGMNISTNTTFCRGNYSLPNGIIFYIVSDNITLDCNGSTFIGNYYGIGIYLNEKFGVTIKNCKVKNYMYGIYLHSSNNNTIINNSILNSRYDGIILSGSERNMIINNTLLQNNIGIYVGWYSKLNILINNSIESGVEGIRLYFHASYNSIIDNDVNSNSRFGIYFIDYSNNNDIIGNSINSNDVGIRFWRNVENNRILKNHVCSNSNLDFNLTDSYNNTGSENSCDTPNGWNDDGITGCSFSCHLITIHSPVNKTYDKRRVLINVTTSEKVKYIYKALNSNRFSKLCEDCDSYSRIYSMREGFNELTIKTVDYEDNEVYETVNFFVDSIEPKIRSITPKDGEYVKGNSTFTIKYTEEKLKNITLYYNASPPTQYPLVDCPSGRYQECSATVDLSSYDGQEVSYHFVICDEVHCINSKMYKVTVDVPIPLVTTNSPIDQVYDNYRIPLSVSVDELVTLEKSLDGSRFRRLCRNCNSYDRTTSFSEGFNNLTIRAIDKAGNEGYNSTTCIVDSKEPRITKIEPKNKAYVKGIDNFTVHYNEDSVKNVSLFYGTEGNMNEYVMDYCPSGRKQQCTVTIDLTAFDNQAIQYYFVVYSYLHNDTSKTYSVTVDNTTPIVTIYSPENKTYDTHRIRLNISISEKVVLEKSIDGDRFRRLCGNCESYERLSYFRDGIYNLTIRAIDKAENEGYASVVFSVES